MSSVPEFAGGKTFVYKYEGWLLAGLPQEGLGKAGVKVSSKVLISGVTQNTFLLKVNLFFLTCMVLPRQTQTLTSSKYGK